MFIKSSAWDAGQIAIEASATPLRFLSPSNQSVLTDLLDYRFFLDITVPLQKHESLRQSLAAQFNEYETLSGSNQYFCESCGAKMDAHLGMKIESLPPILVLSLARFEYDVQAEDRIKNSNRFSFPTKLDMSPYVLESCKSEYSLFSVVIHRGKSAMMGHYHAYIRDVLHEVSKPVLPIPDEPKDDEDIFNAVLLGDNGEKLSSAAEDWFDFDDSGVSPMPTNRIIQQFGGDLECAYMLIYRRTDLDATEAMIPQPDSRLVEEIQTFNADILREQTEEQRKARLLHFTVSLAPLFETNFNSRTSRWTIGNRKFSSTEDERDATKRFKRQLSLDKSSTLLELKKMIAEAFMDEKSILPSPELIRTFPA